MKNLLAFFIVLFLVGNSIAQKNEEKAEKYAEKAVVSMQNDKPKKASRQLRKAIKFNTTFIPYFYRLAYAYHLDGEYEESNVVLNQIVDKGEDNEMVYELLGENYIKLDNVDKAFSAYVKGIKKFPNEGVLYEELGQLEMSKESYFSALEHFENGIMMAPNYPGNYYWASKIYCSSTEEVWGLIYGEIFINLERNTKRTEEISSLLYNTLKREVKINKDSTISISICQDQNRVIDENDTIIKPSFGKDIVELNLIKSLVDLDEISLRSIDKMRENFVAHYFKNPSEDYREHQLFAFHKELIEHGHFEAYNYWLFMMGDVDAFRQWEKDNKSQWIRFLGWFKENSFKIEDPKSFHRVNFQ
jgi:tetratricopeptide (TPR) repeat protein